MKKFFSIIIISFFFFNGSISYSATNVNKQSAEISKIENNLYGFEYDKEAVSKRLERLEISVYGKAQSGDIAARIKKLAADMTAEQIGQELQPSEDTFREADEIADSSVNYPIVDEIEQKLFNQTYKNRDLHTRIVTIERKMFGKIYDVDDYATRMERIKKEIMPETIAQSNTDYNNYDSTALHSSDLAGASYSRYGSSYGQQNYTRPYANYGDAYSDFQPQYSNDDLAQLEYDTFGTEFSNEDTKTRIKRLNSVNKAKKSTKRYDSQKFQQRMSTAMEIGAMILMILAMVL